MTQTRPTIGIMVCTANRPEMLIECLKSLLDQDIDDTVAVEICVVENDQVPRSRDAVEELAKESRFPIHYTQESKRGIPFARNKTLALALEQGYDFIALLDDDEEANENWLSTHLQALRGFEADVSYGPVERTYEITPPKWWDTGRPDTKTPGTVLGRASTNNVLFNANIIKPPHNIRFNEALTFGYEDLDFFENAHDKGFKIVWSPAAIVNETVPASRLHPDRLLAWVKSSAASHVQIGIIRKGYLRSFIKFSIKGIRRVLGGTLGALLIYPFFALGNAKAEQRYYKFRMRLSRGFGNLQGLSFRPFKHYYETIDGN